MEYQPGKQQAADADPGTVKQQSAGDGARDTQTDHHQQTPLQDEDVVVGGVDGLVELLPCGVVEHVVGHVEVWQQVGSDPVSPQVVERGGRRDEADVQGEQQSADRQHAAPQRDAAAAARRTLREQHDEDCRLSGDETTHYQQPPTAEGRQDVRRSQVTGTTFDRLLRLSSTHTPKSLSNENSSVPQLGGLSLRSLAECIGNQWSLEWQRPVFCN